MKLEKLVKSVTARFLLLLGKLLSANKAKGIGNHVDIESFAPGIALDVIGNHNSIRISRGVKAEDLLIYVRGNNVSIIIEDNVSFKGKGSILWLEDDYSSVSIGTQTCLYDNVLVASTEGAGISIGSNCLIAPSVQIRSGDSHAIFVKGIRSNRASPVSISNSVWIGDGAVLLKGVTIPFGSVVATRAVVTKAFHESGSVFAGNPARLVKTGITWHAERG